MRTTAVLAAGAAAGFAYALLEAHAFTVRHAVVPVLDPDAEPVRILHVSDLHLVPSQTDKIAFVRDLATLEPDVVVDTGDNLAHREALPPLLHALEPLLALPGAFVLGSNDYYAPVAKSWSRYLRKDPRDADTPRALRRRDTESRVLPAGELAAELRRAGWKDLTNRRDAVITRHTHLDLVGVDDPHLDRDEFPARAPLPRGALRVGVAHAPYRRVLEAMRHDGAELVLAGHTHGGQLAVPGYGALVTNCDLDRGRAKGLHGWPGPRPDARGGQGSYWLHVSAGLGTSPFAPVRFACRPEATLLELVPAD
ncbi:metallophosphoesterase [Miniimonas arenae]|uniref:Metallophosphoesterase n=1 Tax=Miniimonas arenae TaxID=676201 RepID=A0A5C5BBM0_9MICO|nr:MULTISPECIES: metallophosphoesterase [Miniimonas]TNU74932.1 metallophosphoesterase [Miniimonas arenae]